MNRQPMNQIQHFQDFGFFLQALKGKNQSTITVYSRRGEAKTYSYADLYQDICACSSVLCRAGLKGERIAIAGENSYEWIVAFLSAVACGCCTVLVDCEQPDALVIQAVQNAKAVFFSSWKS